MASPLTLSSPILSWEPTANPPDGGGCMKEKLEKILRRFQTASEDLNLRRALAQHHDSPLAHEEHEAWPRTMERDQ